ncbi:Uncharacterized protein OS=Sorangium cellulosum (strain So ce56) GN=sce5710 PE=4 SV=1 [Gemmata massiliana]|uniref:SMI1/KNR4 family protein n=1 Tax=Gemmata massiliana TaxID=1210884 RepID=A0A6P2D1G7_9BACT|nr:hypothetical protein [Gemmata massiliana]VTR93262.1 Uncharacterized protein OS=Sorangium cellulosum (strain So ce56) GN=sce5710 PE=4 SV=1 [Gemmata massiliana]
MTGDDLWTENEWLTFSSDWDLGDVWDAPCLYPLLTERKYRLFAVACCRRIWGYIPHEGARRIVDELERFADDQQRTWTDWKKVCDSCEWPDGASRTEELALSAVVTCQLDEGERLATRTSGYCRSVVGADAPPEQRDEREKAELRAQCNLVRDLFGNPFRPVARVPEWYTSTVVALAAQMYETRDFGAMPILADALQDAGCDNADVLDHCRGPGPHVYGCWVVDLVLGKT